MEAEIRNNLRNIFDIHTPARLLPMWSFGTTMTMANDREPTSIPTSTKAPFTSSSPQPDHVQSVEVRSDTRTPIFSERSLRQLGIFCAGASFFGLSMLITRRSVARKIKATVPLFYQPSNQPAGKISSDSSLIALEALNLATLNVLGWGIMTAGGLSWAFDVSNVQDLAERRRLT